MRHFISFKDFTADEIIEIVELSLKIKKDFKSGIREETFKNKILGMIFEDSSTRTRLAFDCSSYHLGGKAIFLSSKNIQLIRGESIADTSRVVSSMVDMMLIRTYGHSRIEEFVKYSSVPVINALTNHCHPTQLIADYMTILERGIDPHYLSVSYIGDGNNVCSSWMELSYILGFSLKIATPHRYEVANELKDKLECNNISYYSSAKDAIRGANVVVTDTWMSMGDVKNIDFVREDFEGFQVNKELMSLANKDAVFMHCLPAHRGDEVTDSVIEADNSLVFETAENRLHSAKGIMTWIQRNRI